MLNVTEVNKNILVTRFFLAAFMGNKSSRAYGGKTAGAISKKECAPEDLVDVMVDMFLDSPKLPMGFVVALQVIEKSVHVFALTNFEPEVRARIDRRDVKCLFSVSLRSTIERRLFRVALAACWLKCNDEMTKVFISKKQPVGHTQQTFGVKVRLREGERYNTPIYRKRFDPALSEDDAKDAIAIVDKAYKLFSTRMSVWDAHDINVAAYPNSKDVDDIVEFANRVAHTRGNHFRFSSKGFGRIVVNTTEAMNEALCTKIASDPRTRAFTNALKEMWSEKITDPDGTVRVRVVTPPKTDTKFTSLTDLLERQRANTRPAPSAPPPKFEESGGGGGGGGAASGGGGGGGGGEMESTEAESESKSIPVVFDEMSEMHL